MRDASRGQVYGTILRGSQPNGRGGDLTEIRVAG